MHIQGTVLYETDLPLHLKFLWVNVRENLHKLRQLLYIYLMLIRNI